MNECRQATKAACRMMIRGTPYLNFLCIVLWCQICMPVHAPMLPPMTAKVSSVASEMRHLRFLALYLSKP